MNDHEIRDISEQLIPLAEAMRNLMYDTGVHIEPWRGHHFERSFDHAEEKFAFRLSDKDQKAPTFYFSKVRPRPGAKWYAELLDTKVTSKQLVSMDTASYPNNTDSEITVEWNKTKEIETGVESVQAHQHEWELGAGVKTAVSAEAGFSAFGAEAKVSASVEAEVSAKYGEENREEETKHDQETETDEKRHDFVVPARSQLDVGVTYEAGTGEARYTKTLPIDVGFSTSFMHIGDQRTYDQFYNPWFGNDLINSVSLLDWLGGFFGMSNNSNDFREGLDITFSSEHAHKRDMIDNIRENIMVVKREYAVSLKNATNFTFATTQREL